MNEQYIFNFLNEKIGNAVGACAVMGNLWVESSCRSVALEGTYAKKFGMTSQEYTDAFDNASEEEATKFFHDSAGYGLAQWTYWSRKKGLYTYAKAHNSSVGDLDIQLNYLWEEIQKYKKVMPELLNPDSLRTASDAVAIYYEKPTHTEEKYLQNRANYGQKFYDQFVIKMEGDSKMNSAAYVDEKIAEIKLSGIPLSDEAWEAAKLCIGWPYTYGARGGKITRDGVTVRTFDCRGFTYWILLQFGIKIMGAGATSQWNDDKNWAEKGEIKDIPDDKLVCLFQRSKDEPKKMAHTGFGYHGETIECQVGVQYFAKRKTKWTHWAIPKGLYGGEIIPPYDPSDVKLPTLRKGSKGEYVTVLQTLLLNRGYKLPKYGADGSFGDETVAAVKQFQQDWGLTVDGIVGPNTWKMLETSPDKQQLYTVTIPHISKEMAEDLLAKYVGTMALET